MVELARGRRWSTAGRSPGGAEWLLASFGQSAHKILNVGAGVGATISGSIIVNLDHVLPALDERSRPQGTGNAFRVVADAERLPFRDGVFDEVLWKDVLEHLPMPLSALAEGHRVVTENGRLIATVPRAIPRAVWADPTHIRGFTRGALRAALEVSGWHTVTVRRMGSVPLAGRLGLSAAQVSRLCQIPLLGRPFGLNWLAVARRVDASPG